MPRPFYAMTAVVLLAFVASGLARAQPDGAIGVKEAYEMVRSGKLVLIDIRRPSKWRQTGVPAKGRPITMHQNGRAFITAILAAVGGDAAKPIALICATGFRSANLRERLTRLGFRNVYNVAPGMLGSRYGVGWIKAGLPVRRVPQ